MSRLYHSGIATFMGAPIASPKNLEPGTLAVLGIPYDYASGSRPGARWGPRAIRQSSLFFDYFFGASSDQEYIEIGTGKTFRFNPDIPLVDLGDVELYPMDVARTTEMISRFLQEVTEKGALPLILGGDHYVTYPAFCGFARGVKKITPSKRVGYVHLDAHCDLFDDHPAWGRLYHGSTVRRITESQLIDPSHILIAGVSGFIGAEWYEFLQRNKIKVLPLRELRSLGIEPALRRGMDSLAGQVDVIYLSIDIDLVSSAFAPGTGGITFDGVTDVQLLEMMSVLKKYPVGAVDVVEVAPNYDESERTQRLAAQVLFEFIMHKGNPVG